MVGHPKFLKNPLYIGGISYMGLVTPIITMKVYEAQYLYAKISFMGIQGYILGSPLTDKFMDFNSRLEYSHRMALISNDIYESAIRHCRGNYVNIDTANPLCAHSLQRYKQVSI
ncbi:putative peptidase S10, serine carboxypeptidase, alpha/Beta hydrolase [Helianthus annuus]|uniref:Peptidase S10, serine carboxypeptidase, alpha/Beta hydrolase n=1 Tax=Helianthus annuus TaxID=4232 RepID=A0A9K3H1V6_HELAN|nr:putative peptidase S10, serine carboxypeptidase, alpha/Beta hydrolase [Helianthus annuus]KAJ0444548.1 putative peptidase S10, serine carboxypeptidase, alpha/Beta hydrolase [Helianthus annuus]KAJ0461826.1 putative peptidase S10, serine carboxypeptidase, alpha/Beta hydrolase [Helianthus annuus]KAJ0642213.1 putative peptidase S10, serine carboxypeptidase, alpha/Beta hydrolase [Helianthus annuus]